MILCKMIDMIYYKSLNEQLSIYRQQHTKRINVITHYIGVPAIVFAVMMLLSWISITFAAKWEVSFAWISLLATLIYYVLLNVRLALCAMIVMVPMTVIAIWIARPTPTIFSGILFLILFVGGWVLQLVGHFFEKQKPAFLLGITQLLIGPLFVLIEVLKALGLEKHFVETQ